MFLSVAKLPIRLSLSVSGLGSYGPRSISITPTLRIQLAFFLQEVEISALFFLITPYPFHLDQPFLALAATKCTLALPRDHFYTIALLGPIFVGHVSFLLVPPCCCRRPLRPSCNLTAPRPLSPQAHSRGCYAPPTVLAVLFAIRGILCNPPSLSPRRQVGTLLGAFSTLP